jgi:hypothetical protein
VTKLVEAVFGFAALSFVAAFVFAYQKRYTFARRYAIVGGIAAAAAILLEVYLRSAS